MPIVLAVHDHTNIVFTRAMVNSRAEEVQWRSCLVPRGCDDPDAKPASCMVAAALHS
jgi:hypothetical protein